MILRIFSFLVMLWALGFALFALTLPRPAADDRQTDAIVVLTGGKGRLERGVALLARHKAQRLFVSGTQRTVRKKELALRTHMPEALFDCCVDLGREAEDTIGNASETAGWVRQHNYRSIILVTSTYHMPRAALELRRTMPGVSITPFPVVQDTLHLDGWWDFPGTTRLLISEYSKYLLTLAHARPLLHA